MTAAVAAVSTAVPAAVLHISGKANRSAALAAEAFMCFRMLAAKSLRDESMTVCSALRKGDVSEARRAVSMIVGRDTDALDEKGITKAAVETVAENTSDGVVAPLFYMMIAGAPGGFFYKAVNTMPIYADDSSAAVSSEAPAETEQTAAADENSAENTADENTVQAESAAENLTANEPAKIRLKKGLESAAQKSTSANKTTEHYEEKTENTTDAVDNNTTLADGTYKPESFAVSGGTGKVRITWRPCSLQV